MSAVDFLTAAGDVVRRVSAEQEGPIRQAGLAVAEALRDEHRVIAFGTGHSHMIAEELFMRAGGLSGVEAVLEPALMLHEGALKSSLLERLPGYAAALVENAAIGPRDVVVVASNSGRNAVPVEFAEECKRRGPAVVAITSLSHSRSFPSRAASGRKLFEIADIVVDNCGVPGDALLSVPGTQIRAGATSTIAGALIAQAIVAEAAALLASWGIEPSLLVSNNVDEWGES